MISTDVTCQFAAFISYASEDLGRTRAIQQFLQDALQGASSTNSIVFLDKTDIRGGQLKTEIEQALSASRVLIVCCSQKAVTSEWVTLEIIAFRRLRPDGTIALVLLDGDPMEAIPVVLREEELRYHDLRRAWFLGVLKPRARDELVRLAALLSERPLRDFINWNRRRVMVRAGTGAVGLTAAGAVARWIYEEATAVELGELYAEVLLEWTQDEGIGKGASISQFFKTVPMLEIRARSNADQNHLHQLRWIENKQFRIVKAHFSVASLAMSDRLEPHPSTAGLWYTSRRSFESFTGSVGQMRARSAWSNFLMEAKLSAIAAPNDLSSLGQDDSLDARRQANQEFDEFYGITATQRDSWNDYGVQALPIMASIGVFLGGRRIWQVAARAARLWEGDEDARGLHVCYFPRA